MNETSENETSETECYDHELAFAIDIDETLVLAGEILPGSKQALTLLSLNKIPHIFLTNNLSRTEQLKADQLNKIFQLRVPIDADQIILNVTPIKKNMCWKDKTVTEKLPFQEIPFYITIEQYCTIFPNSVPLSKRRLDENAAKVKKKIEQRLNLNSIDQRTLKFGAVLIVNCPLRWEECYQIIMDLLNSSDGSIGEEREYRYVGNHIPVITALNNLCYRTKQHPLPRILIKPFNDGLRSLFRQLYKNELQLITYGKPETSTFAFAEQAIRRKYGRVRKIVMIGDSEESDIIGAQNAGWESILVRGLGLEKESKYATYSCKDVLEGLNRYGIVGGDMEKGRKNGKEIVGEII